MPSRAWDSHRQEDIGLPTGCARAPPGFPAWPLACPLACPCPHAPALGLSVPRGAQLAGASALTRAPASLPSSARLPSPPAALTVPRGRCKSPPSGLPASPLTSPGDLHPAAERAFSTCKPVLVTPCLLTPLSGSLCPRGRPRIPTVSTSPDLASPSSSPRHQPQCPVVSGFLECAVLPPWGGFGWWSGDI